MGTDPFVSRVFAGPAVVLADMLDARERRAAEQRRLLADIPDGSSLLSVTLAIPGPVKTSPVLERIFDELVAAAAAELGDAPVSSAVEVRGATGPERLEVVGMPALELKRAMVRVEEGHPLGRLVDLDVLGMRDGVPTPVSRTELGLPPRTCLVCGRMAKACARSRAHSIAEMQAMIAAIIEEGGFEDCGKQG